MKRHVLENKDLLYIHHTDMETVRVVNVKTGDAKETTNKHMIKKTMEFGEECVPPSDNNN